MTKYFHFEPIEYFLRNCKSRWPVFLTGYLEKQLEPLTLRPNNWGPKAGLDIRERGRDYTNPETGNNTLRFYFATFVIVDDRRHNPFYHKI